MAPRYQLASNPGVLCSPAAAAGLGDKLVKSLLFAVPLACLLSRPSGVAAWPQAPKHHPRVALRPYPLPSHTL